jgi:type VI secretion system protein ImpA
VDVVEKLLIKMGGKKERKDAHSSPEVGGLPRIKSLFSGQVARTDATVVGKFQSRADAIAALRQVSQFFKKNEPHSPVAMLADRAAKWAEMPLEEWLESVIKDHATLTQLRELLDIQRE